MRNEKKMLKTVLERRERSGQIVHESPGNMKSKTKFFNSENPETISGIPGRIFGN